MEVIKVSAGRWGFFFLSSFFFFVFWLCTSAARLSVVSFKKLPAKKKERKEKDRGGERNKKEKKKWKGRERERERERNYKNPVRVSDERPVCVKIFMWKKKKRKRRPAELILLDFRPQNGKKNGKMQRKFKKNQVEVARTPSQKKRIKKKEKANRTRKSKEKKKRSFFFFIRFPWESSLMLLVVSMETFCPFKNTV